MVFYFQCAVTDPPMQIYMGRDKHENEELIRWGWPEDIWFHTDKLSSAHVYLRLNKGQTILDIPSNVIEDCVQLTKANSISGSKQNNVTVVYTPWANLKKTGDMDVGQVGFHKQKEVRSSMCEKKVNEIVNRLNKTKSEDETVNFQALKDARDAEERKEFRKVQESKKQEDKEFAKKKEEELEQRSYSSLMDESNMLSNRDCPIDEDDFM